MTTTWIGGAWNGGTLGEQPEATDPVGSAHFDNVIAPLLGSRCLECHSGSEPEGALDLSRRQSATTGGESGPALVPGDLDSSLLWQLVDSDAMPPDGRPPLAAGEKELLREWILRGAPWGEDPIDPFRVTSDTRAGRDWWSLQPLGSSPRHSSAGLPSGIPAQEGSPAPTEAYADAADADAEAKDTASPDTERAASPHASLEPIDGLIQQRLSREELEPSPAADPRTLVRRLYFDLIGLPPAPEVVAEFLADPSEDSYAEIVDRLLASPRYGERWARHWLDIVRFGESDGFERNLAREHAWPYRNWVIDALNDDMPYDQFVRLQIAGDILEPDNPSAWVATGFLVAGIHNTVVANNDNARAFARHEELEDLASTLGQAFLGLTVHCARCHDHKFDPISQEEYYRFIATLDGVEHGERTLLSAAQRREREEALARMRQRAEQLRGARHDLEREVRGRLWERRSETPGGSPLPLVPRAHWRFRSDVESEPGDLAGRLHGGAAIRGGRLELNGEDAYFESEPLTEDLREKTLEVWATIADLRQRGGGIMTVELEDGSQFDSLVLGERQPKHWTAGSENFRRTRDVGGEAEDRRPDDPVHLAVVYQPDGTISLFRDGQPHGKPYRPEGEGAELRTFPAGKARILFGKRHTGGGRPWFAGGLLAARLYDRPLSVRELEESFRAGPDAELLSRDNLIAAMSETEREQLRAIETEHSQVTESIATFPEPPRGYVAVSRKPPVMHLLQRGDVRQKGQEVTPGGIRAVGGDYDFSLPADADDASRRLQLAQWITSPGNPLFARVIVNRIWHHHFGQGIVDTPSDFGFNGGRPSHPELLDYLAGELRRHNYRLKPLHRQIVMSRAYRQAATTRPEAVARDADNRWLWRMAPRRLEAEVIRDSMLLVAGELNLELGGPGYQDVATVFLSGTTYFEPLDQLGVEQQRRTVYRFSPRGERSALLDTFDCPDPSVATPRRQITTTPLQALALWNDEFVLRLAESLARRVGRETAGDRLAVPVESDSQAESDEPTKPTSSVSSEVAARARRAEKVNDQRPAKSPAEQVDRQVRRTYQLVFQRDPTDAEAEAAGQLVAEHGLIWLARALLNSNEFIVVE